MAPPTALARTTRKARPARRGPERLLPGHSRPAVRFTLLELVRVVSEVTDDETEVVATVQHLLASGRVRLCGSFRDDPFV
jgi:hypothetical protein